MILQSRDTFATAPIRTWRQEAANQHQRTNENLGFSIVRPRKVGHDARAFRKAIPTRRQEAANQHQRTDENLGFSAFRLQESQAGCLSFP